MDGPVPTSRGQRRLAAGTRLTRASVPPVPSPPAAWIYDRDPFQPLKWQDDLEKFKARLVAGEDVFGEGAAGAQGGGGAAEVGASNTVAEG